MATRRAFLSGLLASVAVPSLLARSGILTFTDVAQNQLWLNNEIQTAVMPTLSVGNMKATPIRWPSGAELGAGDITAGSVVGVSFDGKGWVLRDVRP